MRQDKEKVFELRKQGKSYREISKEVGISRGTLCEWFKDIEWSQHAKKTNLDTNIKLSVERLLKLNEGRKQKLQKMYSEVEHEAEIEFEAYKSDPLFMAGLMLYAGEGDKRTKNVVRLANTEFFIHKVFLKFIKRFTKIPLEKIRFSVLLYPDLDIQTCRNKWSEELGIPLTNFHKPIVIQGRSKIRRLHFGVGSTIISSSFLKRKILLWIEKSMQNLSS